MEHPRQYLWLTLIVLSVASGNWVYDWPYGARGECRCKSIEALTTTGFADALSCREAFSQETYEYCWTESRDGERMGGITERDCGQYAVTTHPAFSNMDCEVACLKVIVGSLSEAKFLQHCKLETVVETRNKVTPLPTGCFVNYVLGHADFNPLRASGGPELRPLRVFPEVRTAAKCQSLCQQLEECAWFQWRAVPDDECNAPKLESFQRAPLTCELYSYKYIQAVLDFDVGFFGFNREHYADGVCDLQEFEDRGCTDLFKTSSWNPFSLHTNCLNCGCQQKCAFASTTHISGPAYCERGELTDVCSMKPPYEHTTPAPECSTIECEEESTTEAELSSSFTELTTVRTRPPTQEVFTRPTSPASDLTGKTTSYEYRTTEEAVVSTAGDTQTLTASEEGTASTTTIGTDSSNISTSIFTDSTEELATSTTELYTTEESSTGLETMTAVSPTERPCGPCPPCECPSWEPDCQCECPPCPCTDDDCLDAHWEPQDFDV